MIIDPNFYFDPDKHQYFLGKQLLAGTTGLLQEFKLVDFSRVPHDRLEYKKNLGQAVDLACHFLDESRLNESSLSAVDESLRQIIPAHKSIIDYIDAYRKFGEITGFEVLHTKLKLFSRKWLFGGEIDKVGIMDWKGRPTIIVLDTKCTWVMYPATGIQLSAYKMLFIEHKKKLLHAEHLKLPIVKLGLQLKPDGNYNIVEYNNKRDDLRWHACLELHYAKKEFKIKEEDYAEFGTIA